LRAQIDVFMDMKMFMIPFKGLKEGIHSFKYQIDNTFFEVYKNEEIVDVAIAVTLNFNKKSTLLELHFDVEGTVEVACDLTTELFRHPIKTDMNIVVKFGEAFNDENEDVLVIPYEAHEIDVKQFIYEAIALAIPVKKIHPGVTDGTLQSGILDKLKELQPKENLNNDLDPRWDKLKELLTDKNR